MKPDIRIFQSPFELAESLALEIVTQAIDAGKKNAVLTIAVSGGKTPQLLFSVLGDHFAGSVSWDHIHFFWVDERCVPPDSSESNFGMARAALFTKIGIPGENIHRIRGEYDPEQEAERYEAELKRFTKERNSLPCTDIVLLGLGQDGHTASIFPGDEKLFSGKKICVPAVNPATGQKRVTLTGNVINNSEKIIFIVTGKSKAVIVSEILNDNRGKKQFPASYVFPYDGRLLWYLDKDAGSLIKLARD